MKIGGVQLLVYFKIGGCVYDFLNELQVLRKNNNGLYAMQSKRLLPRLGYLYELPWPPSASISPQILTLSMAASFYVSCGDTPSMLFFDPFQI